MQLTDFSEEREKIFSLYGKQNSDIITDIAILREWMLKVPHLPSDMIQDEFLELCLLKNKFSFEKCKKKIETYCNLKADPHYDYVYNRTVVPSKEASFVTPLPKLTDNYRRIVIFKIFDDKAFDMATDLSCNAILREFLLRYDYNDGEIQIIDLRNVPSGVISKFRLNVYADSAELILNGMSARVSALHVVSKIGRTLFTTILPLLPKKLVARLQFHDDERSLKDFIPSKYLPSDYGGDLKSLQDIRADWDTVFDENREALKTFINTKSRLELRQDDNLREEGMQGTFKKLSID